MKSETLQRPDRKIPRSPNTREGADFYAKLCRNWREIQYNYSVSAETAAIVGKKWDSWE
jgi:hypothetical protein